MKIIEHIVMGEEGVHARIAVTLAHVAKKYSAKIIVRKDDKCADLKNMMETVALCIKQNQNIYVEISGEDEIKAADDISRLIENL